MIMNITEFQILSKRTMPITKVDYKTMLTEYAMGLVGESIEYSLEVLKCKDSHFYSLEKLDCIIENCVMEAGDVLHYAVGLMTLMGEELSESVTMLYTSQKGTLYHAGDISEMVKKHVFNGHDLDRTKLITELYQLIDSINYVFQGETTLSDVMERNIEKLKKRYPGDFNAADSIARKDVEG